MKINLLMSILLSIFIIGCSDKEEEVEHNSDYLGKWNLTYTGTYANGDCTGELTESSSISSSSITLNENGTYLMEDGLICQSPGNADEDLCKGDWWSSGSVITITSLFGDLDYDVLEDGGIRTMAMENSISGESNGVPFTQCSKTIYTQE